MDPSKPTSKRHPHTFYRHIARAWGSPPMRTQNVTRLTRHKRDVYTWDFHICYFAKTILLSGVPEVRHQCVHTQCNTTNTPYARHIHTRLPYLLFANKTLQYDIITFWIKYHIPNRYMLFARDLPICYWKRLHHSVYFFPVPTRDRPVC